MKSAHPTTDSSCSARGQHHLRAPSLALDLFLLQAAPAGQGISNTPSFGDGALPSQFRYRSGSSLPSVNSLLRIHHIRLCSLASRNLGQKPGGFWLVSEGLTRCGLVRMSPGMCRTLVMERDSRNHMYLTDQEHGARSCPELAEGVPVDPGRRRSHQTSSRAWQKSG